MQKEEYANLDAKCLSCSQNPTDLKTAFKMACLSYHPSDVEYKSIQFTRNNLLEVMGALLNEAKECHDSLLGVSKKDVVVNVIRKVEAKML